MTSPSSQLMRKRLPQASSERVPRLNSCSSRKLLSVGQPSACWARNDFAALWILVASAREDVCPSRATPRLCTHHTPETLAPRPSTASAAAIGVTPLERERERELERVRADVMTDSNELASDVPARTTRKTAENARRACSTRRATAANLTREEHPTSARCQIDKAPIKACRTVKRWFYERSTRAVPTRGENLAGVQQILRIEHALQVALQRDQIRPLFERQIRSLEHANAVLPAERAAQLDHIVK